MERCFEVLVDRSVEENNSVAFGHFPTPSLVFASGRSGTVCVYDGGPLRLLNFNRSITALSTVTWNKDLLVVGFAASFLVYDVEENADVFYKDVEDGVHCFASGQLLYVGGTCSLFGFSDKASEDLWMVTGDRVLALAFHDRFLFVAEDYDVTVYEDETVVSKMSERGNVLHVSPAESTKFAYGLAHAVGFYDGHQILWRFQSKHRLTALCLKEENVVAGWSDGSVVVRDVERGGTVIFRDKFDSKITFVGVVDLRQPNHRELVALSEKGQLRGYSETVKEKSTEQAPLLVKKKKRLQQQLSSREKSELTPETSVDYFFEENDLVLRATAPIASAIVGDDDAVFPSVPQKELRVALLRDITNQHLEKKVQAHVCADGNFHVFDLTLRVPKFAFLRRSTQHNLPCSYVTVHGLPNDIVDGWIRHSFTTKGTLEFETVTIRVEESVTIFTEDFGLAADLVEDLVLFVGSKEWSTEVSFPEERRSLQESLERVGELEKIRSKMTAEMADASHLIKLLVVKLEDARLLSDMVLFKRHLRELYDANSSLVAEYNKRASNHAALLAELKRINETIQRSSKLKRNPIKQECRERLKKRDISTILTLCF